MKTTTLIIFALLTVGCSTWTPSKTVTLHDVDAQFAQTEGADLRYLSVPGPHCEGPRGCRDTTTASDFQVYKWSPLCDGEFCGTAELEVVDVAREAAHVAFAAEQLIAAQVLLRSGDLSGDERLRYQEFVQRTHLKLPQRIEATALAFNRLKSADELDPRQRDKAFAEVTQARQHLERARSLMSKAGTAHLAQN